MFDQVPGAEQFRMECGDRWLTGRMCAYLPGAEEFRMGCGDRWLTVRMCAYLPGAEHFCVETVR